MDDNMFYKNGKPLVEISNKMTTDFSKSVNKGNAPKPQDIENIIKSISKKGGE